MVSASSPAWSAKGNSSRPDCATQTTNSSSKGSAAKAQINRTGRRLTRRDDSLPAPMDKTLILVKPDAFARGLTGEIIARFERKGLRIVALKHMQIDKNLASQHYAEHEGKPFFGELVDFIT